MVSSDIVKDLVDTMIGGEGVEKLRSTKSSKVLENTRTSSLKTLAWMKRSLPRCLQNTTPTAECQGLVNLELASTLQQRRTFGFDGDRSKKRHETELKIQNF